jgi:hypothetical protein
MTEQLAPIPAAALPAPIAAAGEPASMALPGELPDCARDPSPGRRPVIVAGATRLLLPRTPKGATLIPNPPGIGGTSA